MRLTHLLYLVNEHLSRFNYFTCQANWIIIKFLDYTHENNLVLEVYCNACVY